MKLNNTQINALADKFYSEIKEKINKTNEENKIKQLYKFKDNYNKGIKLLKDNPFLNSINIIIAKNTNVNLDRDETFESYVNHYNFNRFIKDKKRSV